MRNKAGMSAADFMACVVGGKSKTERLAEYDRILARLDAEIALVNRAPSLEVALAAKGLSSEELP